MSSCGTSLRWKTSRVVASCVVWGRAVTSTRGSWARSRPSRSGSTGSTSSSRCSTGCSARTTSTTPGRTTARSTPARSPGPVQQPRVPFVVAANGPRSLRLAARLGQGWVTYGKGGDTLDEWWSGIAELSARLDATEADAGRAEPLDRYLSLDGAPRFSLESAALFVEMVGRAARARVHRRRHALAQSRGRVCRQRGGAGGGRRPSAVPAVGAPPTHFWPPSSHLRGRMALRCGTSGQKSGGVR